MAKEKTNRLAVQKASRQKLPARCECGGRLIYAYEFQRVWCYCDACTPVVNVNLSKSLTGVRRGIVTESQYLSSTDPAAMRTLLAERGLWTERRCRAFVEACRWMGFCHLDQHNSDYNNPDHYIDCVHDVPNRHHEPAVAALIRDIWGNPWRPVAFSYAYPAWHKGQHVTLYNPDWLTYANGLVPKLARAAVTRECERCGGSGCWNRQDVVVLGTQCKSCKGQGTIPITGPIDPLRLAVLADALEEAGCGEDGILGHLRQTEEKCPYCKEGHWNQIDLYGVIPQPVRCEDCSGTGTSPVSHWWTPSGGCHVIDLLLHAAPVVTVE